MIYIRVDTNEIVGLGHVMRCMSIAKELQRIGEEVEFLYADARTEKIVHQNGFKGVCLHSVWNDLEQEINVLVRILEKNPAQLLLMDTYYVTEKYLKTLKNYVKTAYLDDFHAMVYPVDILINYNISATYFPYEEEYRKKGYNTKLLLGCSYVPLREEFVGVKRDANNFSRKVLLMSGGTDIFNILGGLLKGLKEQIWFQNYEYYVVSGRYNTHFNELIEFSADVLNVHILSNVTNLADYMKNCDIAVTAGGVTTYELCASGTVAVMYTLADNQLEIAKAFSERGIIPWAGDVRQNKECCVEAIIKEIEVLLCSISERKQRAEKMQCVVDGQGCKRLAEMLKKEIEIC